MLIVDNIIQISKIKAILAYFNQLTILQQVPKTLPAQNFIPLEPTNVSFENVAALYELTKISLILSCILIKESYLFLWIVFWFRNLTLFFA